MAENLRPSLDALFRYSQRYLLRPFQVMANVRSIICSENRVDVSD